MREQGFRAKERYVSYLPSAVPSYPSAPTDTSCASCQPVRSLGVIVERTDEWEFCASDAAESKDRVVSNGLAGWFNGLGLEVMEENEREGNHREGARNCQMGRGDLARTDRKPLDHPGRLSFS